MAVRAKEITSERSAKNLIQKMIQVKATIDSLRQESGLAQMEDEYNAMRNSLRDYMLDEGMERIDISGAHATIIAQSYGATFIGTDEDLTGEEPEHVKPLRKIIFGKFKDKAYAKEIWFRCSRRTVVKEQLEEVVGEGILTVDEIAPSFIEKQKRPYVRIFEEA